VLGTGGAVDREGVLPLTQQSLKRVAFKTGREETSFTLRLEPGELVLLELLR
jgi:hypothetical protein